MRPYFIAGAGTDVGKTFVACALIYQLKKHGKKVAAFKPVASGFDAGKPQDSDTGKIVAALGLAFEEASCELVSPWRFAAPLPPHLAALREGKEVHLEHVIHYCNEQESLAADVLLIEGVGGVMSPIDPHFSVLEWMQALQYPVLLVGGTYLGAVTHTLTAYQTLLAHGLDVQAVMICESEGGAVTLQETGAMIAPHLDGELLLALIPRIEPKERIWEYAPDLTGVL